MKISNRKAKFEYRLLSEKIEAGLALTGGEAKAIRTGHLDLSGAVVRAIGNEAWLINANIPVAGAQKYDAKRSRKLLLHKHELLALATKAKQFKLTLVPLAVYTKGRLVKLELALGKPKKKFEKKEEIKKRDIARTIAQELAGK